jgi:hypothetical protein
MALPLPRRSILQMAAAFAAFPLPQSVLTVVTVVHKKNLSYTEYGNGWMLAQTLQCS